MSERLQDTFARVEEKFDLKIVPSQDNLNKLQKQLIEMNDVVKSKKIADFVAPHQLNFLSSWEEIKNSLDLVDKKRLLLTDDYGDPWCMTFFCVDHINYSDNPRNKNYGVGEIHSYYKKRIENNNFKDELQWHYHPKSISTNPVGLGTSFDNTLNEIHHILCHRIINHEFFPTCYRPGYHAEGQDANFFLEQWIPFDFANQRYHEQVVDLEINDYRIANWNRAPNIWNAYHPSRENVQQVGAFQRWVFRCLNIGSRHENITKEHIEAAFMEARDTGSSVLAITNHDYRQMVSDIEFMHDSIHFTKEKFPTVQVQYVSASTAARMSLDLDEIDKPQVKIFISQEKLVITLIRGKLFSVQPYLAILTKSGIYLHDNLNPSKIGIWDYKFSSDFIELSQIKKIAVAYVGENGRAYIEKLDINS